MEETSSVSNSTESPEGITSSAVTGRENWERVPQTHLSSEVWKFYSVYSLNRLPNRAICNFCNAEIGMGNSKSTSSMRNHLRRKHKDMVLGLFDSSASLSKKRQTTEISGCEDTYVAGANDLLEGSDCKQSRLLRRNPVFGRALTAAEVSSSLGVLPYSMTPFEILIAKFGDQCTAEDFVKQMKCKVKISEAEAVDIIAALEPISLTAIFTLYADHFESDHSLSKFRAELTEVSPKLSKLMCLNISTFLKLALI